VYQAFSVINFHCEIEPANLLQYVSYNSEPVLINDQVKNISTNQIAYQNVYLVLRPYVVQNKYVPHINNSHWWLTAPPPWGGGAPHSFGISAIAYSGCAWNRHQTQVPEGLRLDTCKPHWKYNKFPQEFLYLWFLNVPTWNKNKFWIELTRLLSIHYLTLICQLHCLIAVNYVPRFPWLHYLPCLLWLKGSKYGKLLHKHGFNYHTRVAMVMIL
jgi:hypothetical protein